METYGIRKCLNCEKSLSGRIDKKFCDDQCRASYNNRTRRSSEAQIIAANKIIRRNRTILRSLCPLGKATVRREVLKEMGFDFSLFTSIFPYRGNVYYFSYEYGFMPAQEKSFSEGKIIQKVVIIQKQDYMLKPFDPWKFIKSQ